MMNDELITLAATEYENALLSALSETEWETHNFSPKFEEKMQKLCKKVRRKPTFTALKRVAIIALISALLAGSLALTHPTVRAAVVNWAKEIIENVYFFAPKDTTDHTKWEYDLSWLPSGYKLSSQSRTPNGCSFVYKCAFKSDITFTYMFTYNNGAEFIFTEPALVNNIAVSNLSAKIYTFADPGKPKAIVWYNEAKSINFLITADADEETLIKLAESIVLTKDNTHKNPTLPPAAE